MELQFENVSFGGQGKTGVPGENPLGARTRTNNKLNPGPESGNRIRATLVGGECSYHCAIPAPQVENVLLSIHNDYQEWILPRLLMFPFGRNRKAKRNTESTAQ